MKNKNWSYIFSFMVMTSIFSVGCRPSPTTQQPSSSFKSSGPNGAWVCGCGGSCVSTAEDGIPDTWKTIGVDDNCDGFVDLDLAALGANPNHKDIFVQVDTLAPRPDQSDSFILPQTAIDLVVAAFENSPVSNPDGTTGIHLHIIPGNTIAYSKVITLYSYQLSPTCSGNDAQALSDIKATSMSSAKTKAFHYALIADFNTCDTLEHCASCPAPEDSAPAYQSTGISILHGKDFIVSLGALAHIGIVPSKDGSQIYTHSLAGTFMHELGHNFGLRHGGGNDEGPGYKPNYISVMNYRYQLAGIPHTSGVFQIDYSREALNTIDETQLNENVGLGSSDPTLQFTFVNAQCIPTRSLAHGPIDWNGDGMFNSNPVSTDTNPQEDLSRACGDVTNEVMVGHEDWSHLDYGFYNQVTPPDASGAYGCSAL